MGKQSNRVLRGEKGEVIQVGNTSEDADLPTRLLSLRTGGAIASEIQILRGSAILIPYEYN